MQIVGERVRTAVELRTDVGRLELGGVLVDQKLRDPLGDGLAQGDTPVVVPPQRTCRGTRRAQTKNTGLAVPAEFLPFQSVRLVRQNRDRSHLASVCEGVRSTHRQRTAGRDFVPRYSLCGMSSMPAETP